MTKKTKPKMKVVKPIGRPKKWTKELTASIKEKILHEIGINGLSLLRISKLPDFPSTDIVYEWLRTDKEFSDNYAHAREQRAEKIFEEIISISDSTGQDVVYDKDGNPIFNSVAVRRDQLKIDARKWMLSKMQPKKYGDKIDVTTDGNEINQITVFKMPDNGR
ncbi:MAG TPA: hypothetical protein VGF79_00900 [Bacteroidia bacterium]